MPKKSDKKIRYAVVGLGYFAQEAILPAFAHARDNSELTAFVSSDPKKNQKLGAKYGVKLHYSYEQYEDCLRSGLIDAVYIALPNHLHRDYTVRAAEAGIHVLCEKPMAMDEKECEAMTEACSRNKVKLMIAYRLHFNRANLEAIQVLKKKKIGEPRLFSSVFSHQVQAGNIRAKDEAGGGGLWDIGVYCINAARYLFQAEPTSVFAYTANGDPKRFQGVDEIAAAVMRFPKDRLAQFTISQNGGDVAEYRVVGTKGDIQLNPAYEYAEGLAYEVTINGKTQTKKFPKSDQIAPEILYFSDCIVTRKQPEPSGQEGLLDVRIINALYESAKSGRAVELARSTKSARPDISQTITRPPVDKEELVNAEAPSGG
jgi:predicted dehydrogenase